MIGVTVCTHCRAVRLSSSARATARRPAMPRRPQPQPVEECSRCGDPEATPYPDLKQSLCDACHAVVLARRTAR